MKRVSIAMFLSSFALTPSLHAQFASCTGQPTMQCSTQNVAIGRQDPPAGYGLFVAGNSLDSAFVSNTAATSGFSRVWVSNNAGHGLVFLSYGSAFSGLSSYGLALADLTMLHSSSSSGFVIDTTAAAPVVFGVNNLEKMRIGADGNVGIGATAPQRNLVVAGGGSATIQVAEVGQGVTASDGFQIQQVGANTYLYNEENGTLSLGTNAVPRMIVDAGGRVGIGTSTPSARLELQGAQGSEGLIAVNLNPLAGC